MLNIKSFIIISFLSSSVFFTSFASAEIVIIVHPSNTVELSEKDIQRIFLGTLKIFPKSDIRILPIDQAYDTEIKKEFIKTALNKSMHQINGYWARKVFTGKGIPPQIAYGADEVIRLVSKNPNTIGYINSSDVDESVKVIFTLNNNICDVSATKTACNPELHDEDSYPWLQDKLPRSLLLNNYVMNKTTHPKT